MFIGKVYRIMIGCPSDVKKEVSVAKEIIRNWTEINSELNKIVLIPLHWSTNSFPEMGSHPQKIIDRQVVDKSDLLVCIFSSKIGTETDTAESGSIEEIEEHIKKKKPVMLYFRKNVDISSITLDALGKLQNFKQHIKDKTLWGEYSDENEFKEMFQKHLQEFLNENWLKTTKTGIIENEKKYLLDTKEIIFDVKELKMFYKWSNAEDQTFIIDSDRTGLNVYMGVKNGYHFNKGKEEAEFNDFINRLLNIGYIEAKGTDRNGNTIYAITKSGFVFAETLTC